ncbi:hypothetical protein DFH11DRAFT_1548160 [Phellopilus nigrolimitatus]|nr:hypothetical protein DFH11DRAFT_1548160 [Phellopilus nigrolimitatus]
MAESQLPDALSIDSQRLWEMSNSLLSSNENQDQTSSFFRSAFSQSDAPLLPSSRPLSFHEDAGVEVEVSTARDSRLPTFFRYKCHPQWPYGDALVYLTDSATLARNDLFFQSIKIHQTIDDDELSERGLLRIQSNTAIFCRDLDGSQCPKDDVVKAWFFDRDSLSSLPGLQKASGDLLDITSAIVGNKDEVDAHVKGGVEFERVRGRSAENRQSTRCYSMSTSVEFQRQVFHPCRNASSDFVRSDNETGGVDFMKRFNFYCATAAQNGPPHWVAWQKAQADIQNVPLIGHRWNEGFWTATQLNIAGAVPFRSGEGLACLERAGNVHGDSHDHASSMSALLNMSSLSDAVHPGNFFLTELGVYFRLVNHSVVCFSGLHRHASSAPQPYEPIPETDLKKSVRLTVICYPVHSVKEGRANARLALSAPRIGIELGPTIQSVSNWTSDKTLLTFVGDSEAVMDTPSLHTYLARSIYKLVSCICRQLPEHQALRVDPGRLISSFFTQSDHATRDYLPPWLYAPKGPVDVDGHNSRSSSPFTVDEERTTLARGSVSSSRLDGSAAQEDRVTSLRPRASRPSYNEGVSSDGPPKRRRGVRAIDDTGHGTVNNGTRGRPPKRPRPSNNPKPIKTVFDKLSEIPGEYPTLTFLPETYVFDQVGLASSFPTLLSDHFSINPSFETLATIKSHWEKLSTVHNQKLVDWMATRLAGANQLFSFHILWQWLVTTFPHHIKKAFRVASRLPCEGMDNQLVTPMWIDSLVRYVLDAYGTVSKARKGSSKTVQVPFTDAFSFDNLQGHAIISVNNVNALVDEQLSSVVRHSENVVAQWLGLNGKDRSHDIWRHKGLFLHCVYNHAYPGAIGLFLLPEVHKAFGRFFPQVAQSGSSAADLNYDCLISESLSKNDSLSQSLPAYGRLATKHLPYAFAGHEHQMTGPLIDLLPPACSRLVAFWTALMPYPERPNGLSRALSWAFQDPDKRIPFRDEAPSRHTILRDWDGVLSPFHTERVRTVSGLFSAMTFRCTTFASYALIKRHITFLHSVDDWFSKTSGLTATQICDPRAYGAHCHQRSADVVPQYWEVASQFLQDVQEDFMVAHAWFKAKAPGFGDLGLLSSLIGGILSGCSFQWTRGRFTVFAV